MKTVYYIYKEGVYGHGVYWIGSNIDEGKKKADELASNDVDDYHEWQLIKYKELNSGGTGRPGEFEEINLVYTGVRK